MEAVRSGSCYVTCGDRVHTIAWALFPNGRYSIAHDVDGVRVAGMSNLRRRDVARAAEAFVSSARTWCAEDTRHTGVIKEVGVGELLADLEYIEEAI